MEKKALVYSAIVGGLLFDVLLTLSSAIFDNFPIFFFGQSNLFPLSSLPSMVRLLADNYALFYLEAAVFYLGGAVAGFAIVHIYSRTRSEKSQIEFNRVTALCLAASAVGLVPIVASKDFMRQQHYLEPMSLLAYWGLKWVYNLGPAPYIYFFQFTVWLVSSVLGGLLAAFFIQKNTP